MIKQAGIDFVNLPDGQMTGCSAPQRARPTFRHTGGVMEAALRSVLRDHHGQGAAV